MVNETLFFTPDRVVIARLPSVTTDYVRSSNYSDVGDFIGDLIWSAISEYRRSKEEEKIRKKQEYLKAAEVEDILKADKHNFAIPNSEITEIKLKKQRFGAEELKVITRKKPKGYKWNISGLIPEKKGAKLEDCENILRPVFRDKLSIEK